LFRHITDCSTIAIICRNLCPRQTYRGGFYGFSQNLSRPFASISGYGLPFGRQIQDVHGDGGQTGSRIRRVSYACLHAADVRNNHPIRVDRASAAAIQGNGICQNGARGFLAKQIFFFFLLQVVKRGTITGSSVRLKVGCYLS
jgi:hypothetical protein